ELAQQGRVRVVDAVGEAPLGCGAPCAGEELLHVAHDLARQSRLFGGSLRRASLFGFLGSVARAEGLREDQTDDDDDGGDDERPAEQAPDGSDVRYVQDERIFVFALFVLAPAAPAASAGDGVSHGSLASFGERFAPVVLLADRGAPLGLAVGPGISGLVTE